VRLDRRIHPVLLGYTRGVKTAVSIPDPVFQAADRLARSKRVSRSALYAEALELLLARHGSGADVTARLDAVYAETDDRLDPAIAAANSAVLREQW
jgi:hypothetical protein